MSEVVKFPNSNTMKLVFVKSDFVQVCLNRGINMFHMHVPASQISKEIFITVSTCYRCFAIDDHLASSCPQDPGYKICSSCSVLGHTWHNCNAGTKMCVNCKRNHHTLSSECPKRKNAIKLRRKNISIKNSPSSFSNVVKNNQPSFGDISSTVVAKSVACIMLATLSSPVSPEEFSSVLNRLFFQNNLPSLNLCGYNPPSLDTIAGLISGEAATISTHGGAEPPSDIISSGAAGPSDGALSSDRGSVDDGHSSFEKGTDSFEDSCSAAARMTREKNTAPQPSSIGSIGAVGSSVSHSRPDASPSWLNFRVYGTRSTKVSSSSELREAWEWAGRRDDHDYRRKRG